MPDREHGVVYRESGSAKRSRDADIRSHGEQSCAFLGDLNFVSVSTLKVIRHTERRCSSTSNSTERDFVVLARRVGPYGLVAEARDLLFNNLSMPSSGFFLRSGP